jgi:mono/diheme cytochrome c family protein
LRWIKARGGAMRLLETTLRDVVVAAETPHQAEREEEAMKFIIAAAGVAAFAIVGATSGAHAQSAGNAAEGRAFAQQICTECHNIEKGQRPSPNGLAPNFETIARTPGLTAIALTAALRTSHRTMPNIIIPDDDLRNVVAYVLSLQ